MKWEAQLPDSGKLFNALVRWTRCFGDCVQHWQAFGAGQAFRAERTSLLSLSVCPSFRLPAHVRGWKGPQADPGPDLRHFSQPGERRIKLSEETEFWRALSGGIEACVNRGRMACCALDALRSAFAKREEASRGGKRRDEPRHSIHSTRTKPCRRSRSFAFAATGSMARGAVSCPGSK